MNHMTAKNKSIIVADEYLEPRFEKNSKKFENWRGSKY